MIVQYETEHYIFHCIKDSLEENDIEKYCIFKKNTLKYDQEKEML